MPWTSKKTAMPWYQVFEGPQFIGRYHGQRPATAASKAFPKARPAYREPGVRAVFRVLTENTHRKADFDVIYDPTFENDYGPNGRCVARKIQIEVMSELGSTEQRPAAGSAEKEGGYREAEGGQAEGQRGAKELPDALANTLATISDSD